MLPASDLSPDIHRRLASACGLGSVEFHREVGSTNDRAKALACQPLDTPGLVVAEHQTAGRGRGSNTWWATPGALTFSLVVNADQISIPTPWLALGSALAISRAVEQISPKVTTALKWPNDVYARDRKIAGILIERVGTKHKRFVLGVGINVNNTTEVAPQDVLAGAISLCQIAGHNVSLADLLVASVRSILKTLTSESPEAMQVAWHAKCALAGHRVIVESAEGAVVGNCGGVNHVGELVVHSEEVVRRFASARVRLA